MTRVAFLGSLGLLLGGPAGALIGMAVARIPMRRRTRSAQIASSRLVMMLLLVEMRSGRSVLASLQATSRRLPDDEALRRVARTATVSGLIPALSVCDDRLRPVLAQLARAQKSGASLASAMRRMLEQDLAGYRSERLAAARALPVKLMIPVTLVMLPGLVLLLYAPSLIRIFSQLTGTWS